MENVDFLGKGWNWPVAAQNGSIVYAAGEDSIRESILMILGTEKGERIMRPDFGCGIHKLVFAPNDTATAAMTAFYVKEALMEWEPRIELLDVNVVSDDEEQNRMNIEISYNIISTNTKNNLVYPFYLEGKES